MLAIQSPPGAEVVAPRIELPGEAAAGGELPLGLGRQALAGPLRIGLGVLVGDVDDRKTLLARDGALRTADAASSRR